jgi:hypothetical protein
MLVLFLLRIHLLFALRQAGRHAFLVLLLLFLVELSRELLDLSAHSHAVARGVMHWASCATVVAPGRLTGVLVASWVMTSTSYSSSCNCNNGSTNQQLVVAASLLVVVVVIFVVAAALGSSSHIKVAFLPCLWGRCRVPGTSFYVPGTFVRQAEELSDILDFVRGELFQHLLTPHTLAKCNHNRSIADMRDGVVNLRESLGEGAQ